MDSIAFPGGSGTAFIASDGVGSIGSPTGTNQRVDPGTGLVVVVAGPERYGRETIGVP